MRSPRFSIKYSAKYKKAELATKIAKELSIPENLEAILFGLDFPEWMFFLMAAEADEYIVDSAFPDFYRIALKLGLLQLFFHEKKLIFVVPDEVKAGLLALDEDDYIATKSYAEDVIRYASAAVSLYGVLPISLLCEILEEEYKVVSQHEVVEILSQVTTRKEVFYLFEGNVVHLYLVDENGGPDAKDIRFLLEQRAGRPRFQPSTEEFLLYADPAYNDAEDELGRLEEVIRIIVKQPRWVENIHDDIAFACRVDAPVEAILSIFSQYDIVLQDNNDTKNLLDALSALKYRSRTWLLFGHSQDELVEDGSDLRTSVVGRSEKSGSGESGSRIVPLYGNSVEESAKTGRNAPCRCGSGKK